MPASRSRMVSAQVLLFGEGGRRFTDVELVAANAAALQAPGTAVAAATSYFRKAGFEVGPVVGLGFAISGRSSLFEKLFGVHLASDEQGGTVVQGREKKDAETSRSLDVEKLPANVQACVAAIEFPEPPAFGPGQFI